MFRSMLILSVLALAACAPRTSVPPTTAAPPATEGKVTARGSFEGASGHLTSGTVEVVRLAGGGYVVELGNDFTHDGAPDPVVGFGDGQYVAISKLGSLQALTGRQLYAVPATIDVGRFDQVYVWCEEFGVPLGVASLALL
ncbi:MAG: DM13 domain-containing protein [Pseudomonadota bacterium]